MIIFIICSCRPIGRLSILDISDPSFPIICISRDPHCVGALESMNHVIIDEVNSKHNKVKEMWWVKNIDSYNKFVTKYGVAPKGWKEYKPALPLEINKIYEVNGDYFFAIYKDNSGIKSIVSRKLEKVYKAIQK